MVRAGLLRGSTWRRQLLGGATAVLWLPNRAGAYTAGRSRQTIRRKSRTAARLGVSWKLVEDREERRAIVHLADRRERSHPDDTYRNARPKNTDLLDVDLWLVAYSATAEPLLLCVVPVADEWAVLRYFRTLTDGADASAARYLMTAVLVEHLVERGVRYLADTWGPASLPPGLRHFQQMLGFRLGRVEHDRLERFDPVPEELPAS